MSYEKQGIKTEKGEYNRWIKWQNIIISQARNKLDDATQLVQTETENRKSKRKWHGCFLFHLQEKRIAISGCL